MKTFFGINWRLFVVMAMILPAVFVGCDDDDPVETKEVAELKLDKSTLEMVVGETAVLNVAVTPEDAVYTLAWNSDDDAVATVKDGVIAAVSKGIATIKVSVGNGVSSTCEVTVKEHNEDEDIIEVSSVTLDRYNIELYIGDETTLAATVLPENATDKTVTWSSEFPEIVSVDQNGVVKALAAGASAITAMAGDKTAVCSVLVSTIHKPEPEDPKIGDYFYSDGTWSDGGLISIDEHGLNPVWSEVKPEPEAGKTVIGIVCQTSTDRIAQTEKDNGFTRGYVIAVKNAHPEGKDTIQYTIDYDFNYLDSCRLSSSWYDNVNGYYETMRVCEVYGSNLEGMCPAFYVVLNEFTPAPDNTSGWFLPSTGQLWDALANLCGHEVATYLNDWSTQNLNAAYGDCAEYVGYDVIAKFNDNMSEIPAADKDEIYVLEAYRESCILLTSTPCSSETVASLQIGTNGLIGLSEEWTNYDFLLRPILAF